MRRLATLAILAAPLLVGGCMPQSGGASPNVFPLYFSDFSAKLDPEGEQVIKSAADFANAHPTFRITVLGYADPSTGSPKANEYISRTRAQVVADALAADGVAPARIKRDALGATPFAFSAIESRRVEIDIAN